MDLRPIQASGVNLDARRFLTMLLKHEKPESNTVRVLFGTYMSGIGEFKKRWIHWVNRGPREHPTVSKCDMIYFRFFE